MNDNADIPKAALARLERDQEYSRLWGATREDIQNARNCRDRARMLVAAHGHEAKIQRNNRSDEAND